MLKEVLDLEVLRSEIAEGLRFSERSKRGRSPYDSVINFLWYKVFSRSRILTKSKAFA